MAERRVNVFKCKDELCDEEKSYAVGYLPDGVYVYCEDCKEVTIYTYQVMKLVPPPKGGNGNGN